MKSKFYAIFSKLLCIVVSIAVLVSTILWLAAFVVVGSQTGKFLGSGKKTNWDS